jgi:hypothetical protein
MIIVNTQSMPGSGAATRMHGPGMPERLTTLLATVTTATFREGVLRAAFGHAATFAPASNGRLIS